MLEGCKAKVTKPLVFLVYYNIIFAYGVDKFLKRSREAGVSGFIVPDLPCEECEEFALKCKELNLCLVPLISVTSGGRADEILKFGSGFIYVLGAIGVSGSKRADEDRIKNLVLELKQKSDLPVAVGFGIKNKDDVSEVKKYADAAIIGTQIVKLCAKFSAKELVKEVDKLF